MFSDSGKERLYYDYEVFIRVQFEVVTVAAMKIAVFWDVIPCNRAKFTDVSEERKPPSLGSKIC
jgi:hypothetical protein